MRVLVIGGTRFIGYAAVCALARRGCDLLLVNRGRTEPPAPLPTAGVTRLHAAHDELPTIRRRIASWSPDVALDMIASCQREADELVAALRGVVDRVVAISSVDVYRPCQRLYRLADDESADARDADAATPCSEDSPLRTVAFPRRHWASGPDDERYHYDKLHVERTLAAAALDATVLRLPFVYGPADYRRRVASAIASLRAAEPLALEDGQASWRCTRAFVGDVASAIADAVLDPRARGATYNVGEPDAASTADWLAAVARAAKLPPPRLAVSSAPARSDWRHHLVADTSRLRDELDYDEPVGAAAGLRRTIAAASKV